MSRVGRKPIPIPDKVKVIKDGKLVSIEGEKGKLSREIHPSMDLKIEDNIIHVVIENEDRINKALQGMTRSLVANMVTGVSSGFERVLEINGIGYRAELKGKVIVFNLGYSHPINFDLPERVSVSIDKNNTIKLSGIDKEELGRVAASIRSLRPPEPYKGKGIKYAEERIQRKAGKAGAAL